MTESHRKPGPPPIYSKELAEQVCRRISTHDLGIERLCAKYDDMPGKTTIYEWRYDYPEFDAMYLEAKDRQALLMAESIDDIAHEREYIVDENGVKRLDPALNNDKRLRIDTRKWIAARLQPKRYGDSKRVEELQNMADSYRQETLELRAQLAEKNQKDF